MSEESKPPSPQVRQTSRSGPRRLRGLVAVLSALVILLGVTLCKKQMQPASTLIQQGNEAIENRDFPAAWRLARRVLDRHPESGAANLLAGRTSAAVSDFAQALEYFNRVPDDESPVAVQARCDAALVLLLHFKLLSEAEEQLRRAVQQDPRQLRANDHLAFVLGLSSRNWELIPYRLTLIELDHIDPMHLYLLCLGESAVENDHLVNEYHQHGPTDPGPLVALSRLAYESHDYQAAEYLARTAIALSPELVEGHVKLGRVLLQVGADDALENWHENLPSAADDHPGIWAIRAAWAQRQSLEQVAIRCYWETVRRDANHQGANYQLGQRLAAAGRIEEAEPFLERARLLQEYLNVVKVAIGGKKAEEFRAAAQAAERLGLIRESYAWYRLSLKEDPQASHVEQKSQQLRVQFSSMEIPQSRNLAGNNPALNIDLSDFPLPRTGMRGVRPSGADHVASTSFPTFENQASKTNLNFQYFNAGEPSKDIKRMYEFTGGGSGVLDYDRDGWPDLCLTQGCRWPPDVDQKEHLDRLFRNLSGGSFDDVTERAWLNENGFSQGIAVGDFDNDGFSDVYVANIGANRLFHNNGDGTFSEVTQSAGVAGDSWTSSCAFCDVNGDALPDLFDVNYLSGEDVFTVESLDDVSGGGVFMPQYFAAAKDRLYLNLGDSTFADITSTSGIEVADGKGLGLVSDFQGPIYWTLSRTCYHL
ncbi:MAG: FG-GAP-like repeat-containing protein, partial [Pirellulaceae bacterium]